MDLIYADIINHTIVDRGVMHNYTLDLSFGQDENNFVLECPESATKLQPNQVIYVYDTEFGGIIDSIAIDTSERIVTYRGRTFHGILESKKIYPYKNADYFVLNGEANQVLKTILERLSLIPSSKNEMYVHPDGSFLKVSEEDSGIYIRNYVVSSKSGNYASGYTLIRDMLYKFNAKPLIINGVLQAVEYDDMAADWDWLYNSLQFQAKANYNSVNHLHCMGQGELSKRYVIDLYVDADGGVLPYCDDNPYTDSSYYTDLSALEGNNVPAKRKENLRIIKENMITGVNEMCEVYDNPNASVTYHYLVRTIKPANWAVKNTDGHYGFESYYMLSQERTDENEPEFKTIECPPTETRYSQLSAQPSDWVTKYSDYYYQDGSGFHNVTSGAYILLTSQPSNWTNHYDDYYIHSSGAYTKARSVTEIRQLSSQPADWAVSYGSYCLANGNYVQGIVPPQTWTKYTGSQPTNWATSYGSFYYSDGHGNYVAVPGVSKSNYPLLTNKPGDWNTGWGNYYIKRTKKTKVVKNGKTSTKKTTYYQRLLDFAKEKKVKKFKWNDDKIKGKVRYLNSYTVAPKFSDYSPLYTKDVMTPKAPTYVQGTYYYRYSGAPTWAANTYYRYQDCPPFVRGQYFSSYIYQPIPEFLVGGVYERYEDHYQALIEGGLKRLEELKSKSELSIDLSEGIDEYDINDRIAASDEITGIGAVAKVIQKIVKIERGVTSFDYKVGKE